MLMCAVACSAKELPDAPKPKVIDRNFLVAMSALGASKAVDGFTSANLQSGCHENNFVLGRHPSDGQLAGYFVATYAIEVATAYAVKRFGVHHRWARHLWLIEPARQTTLHIYWSVKNEGCHAY